MRRDSGRAVSFTAVALKRYPGAGPACKDRPIISAGISEAGDLQRSAVLMSAAVCVKDIRGGHYAAGAAVGAHKGGGRHNIPHQQKAV